MSGDVVTARQAAHIIGVSERRVRQLCESGDLPTAQPRPLKVPVKACLEMRRHRDKQTKPPETVAQLDLRRIVGEVAEALLPKALEAAASDRDRADQAREHAWEQVETGLQNELAAARAHIAHLEHELATTRTELADANGLLKRRRWGRRKPV